MEHNNPQRFPYLKVFPFEVTKATQDETPNGRPRLHVQGMASTPRVDRDNEIIEIGFFEESLATFKRNPQMRWNHWSESIGMWETIEQRPDGYWVEGHMIDWGDPQDRRRMAMVEEGAVSSMSVGFGLLPGYQSKECGAWEDGVWHWQQHGDLREISICDIPSNMDAELSLAKSLGWTFERLKQNASGNDGSDLDAQVIKNLERMTGASEAVRNTVTHWAKEGAEPGTQVISAVVNMLTTGTDVLKAGRVLSTANRSDIEAVVELLLGVLARDDASRQSDDGDDGKGLLEIVRSQSPARGLVEIN